MGRIVYQKSQYVAGIGDVIDIEYNMNGNVGFELKATNFSGNRYDATCAIGAKDLDTGYTLSAYVNQYINSGNNSRMYYALSGAQSTSYASAPSGATFRATKSGSTMLLYIGDSLRSRPAIVSFTSNVSIYLFGTHEVSEANGTDTATNINKGRIEYCKIYDNGTLVRDLIPVKRITDDSFGMFDKVSKKFFTAKSKDISKMGGSLIADAYLDVNGNAVTDTSSIVSELTHLKETKSLIRDAMIFKGAEVAPETSFRSYPDLIRNLQMSGALLEEEYNNCLGLTESIYPNVGEPEVPDLDPDPEVDPDVEVVTGKFRALNSVYIDTGISPYGKKLRLEFKFGPLLGSYNYVAPFGGYNTKTRQYLPTFKTSKGSGTNKYWSLYLKSGNPLVGYMDLFKLSGMGFSGDTFEGIWETDNDKTVYDLIYTNGSTVTRKTNTIYLTGDFPKSTTLMLFAQNTENGADTNTQSSAYFYYFRIYLDNKIVRSFIPAKKDGVYCLYDKVSKTYFYSLGTGNFSVG